MESSFIKLPAQFKNNRIFLCPITENGDRLEFYTDTGGGGMFISPDAVSDLKLPRYKRRIENNGEVEYIDFPKFQNTSTIPAGEDENELMILPEIPWGNGFLGHTWFSKRVWKLDYVHQEMGYTKKDSTYETKDFQSTNLGFKYDDNGNQMFSFPRIQIKVDGELLDFLFDTGATVDLTEKARGILGAREPHQGTCFITESIFEKWRNRHPEWTVIEDADQFKGHSMIEVPSVEVAGLKAGSVWFTARPEGNFHQNMSHFMDKQIDGAVGGSLFQYFSIIIDYPDSKAHFQLG